MLVGAKTWRRCALQGCLLPRAAQWRRGAGATSTPMLKAESHVLSPRHAETWCGAPQGFPLPSAAQVAARLRRFAARLSAEDVLPNSKAYVVAALFPDEASAAAAAAHLRGAADAMFSAATVPCALPCVLLKQEVDMRLTAVYHCKAMHAVWRKTSPSQVQQLSITMLYSMEDVTRPYVARRVIALMHTFAHVAPTCALGSTFSEAIAKIT